MPQSGPWRGRRGSCGSGRRCWRRQPSCVWGALGRRRSSVSRRTSAWWSRPVGSSFLKRRACGTHGVGVLVILCRAAGWGTGGPPAGQAWVEVCTSDCQARHRSGQSHSAQPKVAMYARSIAFQPRPPRLRTTARASANQTANTPPMINGHFGPSKYPTAPSTKAVSTKPTCAPPRLRGCTPLRFSGPCRSEGCRNSSSQWSRARRRRGRWWRCGGFSRSGVFLLLWRQGQSAAYIRRRRELNKMLIRGCSPHGSAAVAAQEAAAEPPCPAVVRYAPARYE